MPQKQANYMYHLISSTDSVILFAENTKSALKQSGSSGQCLSLVSVT